MNVINEGWAFTHGKKGGKTHYYRNGISLCKKQIEHKTMVHFDKERDGSKYFCDCGICIKKLKII